MDLLDSTHLRRPCIVYINVSMCYSKYVYVHDCIHDIGLYLPSSRLSQIPHPSLQLTLSSLRFR